MPNGQSICDRCNYQTKNSRILWEKILFQSIIIIQCHEFERFLFCDLFEVQKLNYNFDDERNGEDKSFTDTNTYYQWWMRDQVNVVCAWFIFVWRQFFEMVSIDYRTDEIISVNEFFYFIFFWIGTEKKYWAQQIPGDWVDWNEKQLERLNWLIRQTAHTQTSQQFKCIRTMHSKCSSLSDRVEASSFKIVFSFLEYRNNRICLYKARSLFSEFYSHPY